ncbi:MAG: ribosome-associated translation inhibitor RaiA [Bacteroidales bacterium]|nr:ribosome-associated translation inhibitor RaiA [Bacteroidales bacterium]
MDIKIHSIRFNADVKLLNFIRSKVDKLVVFYDDIIGTEVFLRLDNSQDLENKVVEIKLTIPGNELFAKRQTKTFEESTDLAVEALRRQIRKHKTKLKKA